MKITKQQIKQLIKEELENVLGEEDTLPPQGSPPKKRGFVDTVKEIAKKIYSKFKGMFIADKNKAIEDIEQKLNKESPHVQKILKRHAEDRAKNAKQMDDFLKKLTVAKLPPEPKPDDTKKMKR